MTEPVVVRTSVGEVTAEFGLNSWVMLEAPLRRIGVMPDERSPR